MPRGDQEPRRDRPQPEACPPTRLHRATATTTSPVPGGRQYRRKQDRPQGRSVEPALTLTPPASGMPRTRPDWQKGTSTLLTGPSSRDDLQRMVGTAGSEPATLTRSQATPPNCATSRCHAAAYRNIQAAFTRPQPRLCRPRSGIRRRPSGQRPSGGPSPPRPIQVLSFSGWRRRTSDGSLFQSTPGMSTYSSISFVRVVMYRLCVTVGRWPRPR